MKTIALSQGFVALVDDLDYDILMCWSWHTAKSNNGCPYARTWESEVSLLMARAIGFTGEFDRSMHRLLAQAPVGLQVDHVDQDMLNNQRFNLRLATNSQNGMNRGKLPSRGDGDRFSEFKGVYGNPSPVNPWSAEVRADGKRHYLGRFKTQEEAAMAYNVAASKLHGEFARLNVIEMG